MIDHKSYNEMKSGVIASTHRFRFATKVFLSIIFSIFVFTFGGAVNKFPYYKLMAVENGSKREGGLSLHSFVSLSTTTQKSLNEPPHYTIISIIVAIRNIFSSPQLILITWNNYRK